MQRQVALQLAAQGTGRRCGIGRVLRQKHLCSWAASVAKVASCWMEGSGPTGQRAPAAKHACAKASTTVSLGHADALTCHEDAAGEVCKLALLAVPGAAVVANLHAGKCHISQPRQIASALPKTKQRQPATPLLRWAGSREAPSTLFLSSVGDGSMRWLAD